MIKIPLTEVNSGKKYALTIPEIKTSDGGYGIQIFSNQVIEFLDAINLNMMNIALQFDMNDNVFTPETVNFVTNSGKKCQVVRGYNIESDVYSFSFKVEINNQFVTIISKSTFKYLSTPDIYYGIETGKLSPIMTGISIIYAKDVNAFYTSGSSATSHEWVSSEGGYKLYNWTASQVNNYEPEPQTDLGIVQNTIYTYYKDDAKRRISWLKQDNMATWFNSLPDKDWSKPEYPDPSPDPEPDPEPDPPLPGDGDTESEPIPDPPPLPTFDVTNTGFVVVYNPTVIEIRDLAYFMWSGDFTDLIKKMFGSPFEALISLKMLFSPIVTGAKQTVWLGNVETTVSMSKVTQQFVDVDMGIININEFFGSFADYAPYTKIHIFLPFIGYKDLNVDEVMNAQIHLRYRIDVYSGACIAFITVTKAIKSTQLNSILYQFDGNCAMEIPFTSNDNSRYVSAILNAAASSALSLANTSSFSPPQIASGFQKGEKASLELGSLAPVANGMLDVLSVKPNVQRAGSLAGAVAAMGIKTPYIIIHRPIAQIPTDYQHYYGIPLNLSMQLSKLSGFTVVSQVFFQSQTATEREIDMITELLRNGVIF